MMRKRRTPYAGICMALKEEEDRHSRTGGKAKMEKTY